MRNSFIKALEEHTQPETIVITGDLGFKVFDDYIAKYPKQFLNAGVAEQNMTGIAAGLALSGKKVFTYSIANFNTLRPLEFIRNDVAYHELNVTIVSIGSGLGYGSLGISHHATEDIGILRTIPNLTVIAPGDSNEAYVITKKLLLENMGPVYLRLGRSDDNSPFDSGISQKLQIGKALPYIVYDSRDVALLSTGNMLETSKKIHDELLDKKGIQASIFSFHTLKPFDKEKVHQIFRDYKYVISMEEHSIIGGLNSSILESLVGTDFSLKNYIPFALPSSFTYTVGDQDYLRDVYDISEEKIFKKLSEKIQL